jgi:alkanesulfonate monooxygenase SsuD/methylene tetrahydromethanopterin reductase-like flavin-dependent oxidoreductase (luciferase family)
MSQGLRFGILHEVEVRGRSQDAERTMFANVIDQVRLAEELAFESCWFVEHHFTRGFSHSSAPDLILAAISQVTTKIRLGLGVMLLPFVHPVRVAERVGTLDVLSGGRVDFGTGRGASPLEYQAFQRPFELSREIWEDHLDAVLEIMRADSKEVTRKGTYYDIPGVSVLPRVVQKPHPPVWVASTSLDGFIAAAKQGYHLLCMPILKGIDDLAEDIALYRKTLAEHGHDPEAARVAMLVPWHLAATRDEAEQAADAVLWYIRRQVNLVAPPDYMDSRHATYKVLGQLAAGMSPERSMDALRDNLMVVVDDIEGSRRAVKRVAEAGATDLLCQFQVGGLEHERVTNAMRLFASEVGQL